MNVEVNEQNIILFGLVQLTGNSTEQLMQAASEAEEKGYVLTCEVPGAEQLLEQNVFEAAGSEPVPLDEQNIMHVLDEQLPSIVPKTGESIVILCDVESKHPDLDEESNE